MPVKDYITDVILPEMNALVDMGTEIMWCMLAAPFCISPFASTRLIHTKLTIH